ncbi:hypothetical protein BDA96_02G446000 [Sorghum bicolor]|jgi:hypothetical protein|uniref:IBH1-like N-terminal domain-containing protein n=2 Tax=Sorghum bicolor TaxID=4558 RepID=C5X6C5_SORBI|nr:transcription factor bHLH148 [Sorghum bicolor]EER99948.1 hypothetical protein SORBI_3002G425900 [Sorghum bicolor]KAG0546423.1 hypothetical protein BDA96_02G446000 [Sorghum bicolor]|eukprot:XP_002463427.1 transcription factor bHLH148 [Sorghum bicolor]
MPSSSADDEGARGKRKRGSSGACASDGGDHQQGPSFMWRTPRAQQAYSSKLLQALRLVRGGGTGTPSTCSASAPAVRDAAYRALAVAARGRSRWSRTILARSRRCRALQCLRARRPPPPRPRRRQQQGGDSEQRAPGGLAGRAKVLGRLVPGCQSLSLPALLAEVSDYIAALEMQVRAMGQLTQDLASSSSAPTAAPSIAPP